MHIGIIGAESYVGEHAAEYIIKKEPDWIVEQIDVRTDSWKEAEFGKYNVVILVAGIAHRKITKENEYLYYEINRDLAIAVAKKAKQRGVQQFIFMSTMSVYSDDVTFIDSQTPTNPDNAYGNSKLQAEQELSELSDENFKVAILRPPMIYGKGCKGNYNSLRAIALKSPIFPSVDNKRSMLFIDNLSELFYQLILKRRTGIFYPQNKELVNTTEWAQLIAKEHGKDISTSKILGVFVRIGKHVPILGSYCTKAFGDSYYDSDMSIYSDMPYQLISFKESITRTEK